MDQPFWEFHSTENTISLWQKPSTPSRSSSRAGRTRRQTFVNRSRSSKHVRRGKCRFFFPTLRLSRFALKRSLWLCTRAREREREKIFAEHASTHIPGLKHAVFLDAREPTLALGSTLGSALGSPLRSTSANARTRYLVEGARRKG
uniref:Uncharacterized protein n=1 Tax=Vespula pensylvanica TaxID=30213 RepID=A0A834PD87_VESPE|nr:hypothetical protein H0235_000024 [Vespula pensylvanica]